MDNQEQIKRLNESIRDLKEVVENCSIGSGSISNKHYKALLQDVESRVIELREEYE